MTKAEKYGWIESHCDRKPTDTHEVVDSTALSPSVETSKVVEFRKKGDDFVEGNEVYSGKISNVVKLSLFYLSVVAPFASFGGSGFGASSPGAAQGQAQEIQFSDPAPSGGGGGSSLPANRMSSKHTKQKIVQG